MLCILGMGREDLRATTGTSMGFMQTIFFVKKLTTSIDFHKDGHFCSLENLPPSLATSFFLRP